MFKGANGSDKRHALLPNNFFSSRANANNSTESASPATMALKYKTIYLLEELHAGGMHTQLLKQVAAMDTLTARGLYCATTDVELQGRLFINANTSPQLGEENAIWDRAVIIPWDTRYVSGDEKVDIARYRLPSDNKKADYLETLTDAFLTVCLQALTKFLRANPTATEFPLPARVIKNTQKHKDNMFPLNTMAKVATFAKENSRLSAQVFYDTYRGYCADRGVPGKIMSLDQVLEKLHTVDIKYVQKDNEDWIIDRALTDIGRRYATRGCTGRQMSASSFDGPLQQCFKRQRNSQTGDDTKSFAEEEDILNGDDPEWARLSYGDLPDIDAKPVPLLTIPRKPNPVSMALVRESIDRGPHVEDGDCRLISCPGPHKASSVASQ